jgi:ribosomal protein L33
VKKEKIVEMRALLKHLGLALLAVTLSFTACKKASYTTTNSKRIKHQQVLKGKYNEPTDKLAKGSKLKGEY